MAAQKAQPCDGGFDLYSELPDYATVLDKQGAHKGSMLFAELYGNAAAFMGCTVEFPDGEKGTIGPFEPSDADENLNRLDSSNHLGSSMSSQDRYIDARLAGIESKLDVRMEAMQRFQDQAEDRREQQRKESDDRFHDAIREVKDDSKRTRITVVTTTIATAIAVVGIVATILYGNMSSFQQSVSEQGAWLRQSIDRIEQRVTPPPAETSSGGSQ